MSFPILELFYSKLIFFQINFNLMYIYKNFEHTFIKIGGASLCQKIQRIIKKETTTKIAKKIITINNFY